MPGKKSKGKAAAVVQKEPTPEPSEQEEVDESVPSELSSGS